MPSARHAIRLPALIAAGLAATACVGTHAAGGPQHSVAEVRSALRAVGLTGVRPIPRAEMRTSKQTPGVDPAKILGGFELARVGEGGSVVAATIAVVADRSIIRAMEAGVAKEGGSSTLVVRHAEAGNVVVFSAAGLPTAADRRLLARIPRLVAYLDAH
jgi:hypothetical protein